MPKKTKRYRFNVINLQKAHMAKKCKMYNAQMFTVLKDFINRNLSVLLNAAISTNNDTPEEDHQGCPTDPQLIQPKPELPKEFDSRIEEIRLTHGYDGCWMPVYRDVLAFIQLYVSSSNKDESMTKINAKQERILKELISRKSGKEISVLADEKNFQDLLAFEDAPLNKEARNQNPPSWTSSSSISKKLSKEKNNQNECASCPCRKKLYTPVSCSKKEKLLKGRVIALEQQLKNWKSPRSMENVLVRLANLENIVQCLVNNQSSEENRCSDPDLEWPAEHNSSNIQSDEITIKTEISLDDVQMEVEDTEMMSANIIEENQDPLAFDQHLQIDSTHPRIVSTNHANDIHDKSTSGLNVPSTSSTCAEGQIIATTGSKTQPLQPPKGILFVVCRKQLGGNSRNVVSTAMSTTTTASIPVLLARDETTGHLIVPSKDQNQGKTPGPVLQNSKPTVGTSQFQNKVESEAYSFFTTNSTSETKNKANSLLSLLNRKKISSPESTVISSKVTIPLQGSASVIQPQTQSTTTKPSEGKPRIFYKLSNNLFKCKHCLHIFQQDSHLFHNCGLNVDNRE